MRLPIYSSNQPTRQNFTSIYYRPCKYVDCHNVKRESQNSTERRNDLNYEKLARISKLRFKDFDTINIMPMNASDATEVYYTCRAFVDEFGLDEYKKKCGTIHATDICEYIINEYPKKGLVNLYPHEYEELVVNKNHMFVEAKEQPKVKETLSTKLYELKPEYRKYFTFGVQDFQERISSMEDRGNSVVYIRNCLRQSFGDTESAMIVYKLANKLKGLSLLITGGYDRGMPLFESALDDYFFEIDKNIWAKRDSIVQNSADIKLPKFVPNILKHKV